MEVGGEGAGGQPAKKQLKETELVNRHSLGGDAHCSSSEGTQILPAANTHSSCSAHTNQNLFSSKGQMRALLQSALDRALWHSHQINQLEDYNRGSLFSPG